MENNMQFILGFLGRHTSMVLPLGVLVGLFVPCLADSFQPLLIPALFVPLTLSLVRIETSQLRRSLLRWHWVALLSFWILILRPVAVWAMLQFFPLPAPIVKAVLITAAAPPVTACAAIAIFLGVDAAIVVAVTVATMLLVPLSLPPMVYWLVDLQIKTELWQLSLHLALFIFAAFIVAALIKKSVGQSRIHQNAAILDGTSVVFIGIFIIGIMHGVTDKFMQQPWYVLQLFVVSTLLVVGLYVFATVLFWRLGPGTAMAIGLVSGNCNMGLMYLILVDQATLDVLIFFAIGQIPMYFLPSLLAPLIKRLLVRGNLCRTPHKR
jgi:bile acid:Na+ symporter, BASS family